MEHKLAYELRNRLFKNSEKFCTDLLRVSSIIEIDGYIGGLPGLIKFHNLKINAFDIKVEHIIDVGVIMLQELDSNKNDCAPRQKNK